MPVTSRITVTQGPVQSLNAAATVGHLERSGRRCRNVLLVGGTSADVGDDLTRATIECAAGFPWDRVVEVGESGRDDIGKLLGNDLPEAGAATELVCVRNWQTINEAAIDLFPAARRVAYGDGLGVIDLVDAGPARRMHEVVAPLPQIELRDSLEGLPLQIVPRRDVLAALAAAIGRLPGLVEADHELADFAEGGALVLTANLTEAGLTTRRAELRQFLRLVEAGAGEPGRVVLKGHPRSSLGQATQLARLLRSRGYSVRMVPAQLDAYPVELFPQLATRVRRVVAGWSSSAVSLRYLHGASVDARLPLALAATTMFPSAIRRGLSGTAHHRAAVEALDDWDGSGPLDSVPIDPPGRLERGLGSVLARPLHWRQLTIGNSPSDSPGAQQSVASARDLVDEISGVRWTATAPTRGRIESALKQAEAEPASRLTAAIDAVAEAEPAEPVELTACCAPPTHAPAWRLAVPGLPPQQQLGKLTAERIERLLESRLVIVRRQPELAAWRLGRRRKGLVRFVVAPAETAGRPIRPASG